MASLWCDLLCKLSINTWKSGQWITIIVSKKLKLEYLLLLIFIYSNSKFKVTCKNRDIECQYIRTQTKEKTSKTSNITYIKLPFSHTILHLNCHLNPNLPDPVNFVPFGTMTYSPFDINLMNITWIKFVYLYFCLFLNKA